MMANRAERKRRNASMPAGTRLFKAFVNAMHNYERSQWGRAGYPGLRQKDVEGPLPFAMRLQRKAENRGLTLARYFA